VGIYADLMYIVTRGGHADGAIPVGVIDGVLELRRIGGEIETHAEDIGAVLHGVINRAQNIGGITGTIGLESLQGHDIGLRRNQVYDAGGHSAVAEGSIVIVVENG